MTEEEIKKLSDTMAKGFMSGLALPKWSLSDKRPISDQLTLLGYQFKGYVTPDEQGNYYEIYPTSRKEFEGHPIKPGSERLKFKMLSEVQSWVDEVAQMRRERATEKGEVSLYDFMHGVREVAYRPRQEEEKQNLTKKTF